MKAPASDQLALLDLQDLDSQLARLRHELRSLPAFKRITEIKTELSGLGQKLTVAKSAQNDAKKALAKAEDDVEEVRNRTILQRSRLDSGQGGPKELQNIAAEIDHLVLRQASLEDIALETMEACDAASDQVQGLLEKEESLQDEKAQLQASGESESAALHKQIDEISEKREKLADSLHDELVETYNELRESTGGAGVVALRGVRSEGTELQFNSAELNRIRTAQPDDVIVSEEHEVILVRLQP